MHSAYFLVIVFFLIRNSDKRGFFAKLDPYYVPSLRRREIKLAIQQTTLNIGTRQASLLHDCMWIELVSYLI